MQELESGDEAEAGVDPQKAKDIVFEKNGRGHFILPPLDDQKTTKQRQKVIRGYIGAVYRESFKTILISVSYSLVGEFTGYSKAVFPYLLASAEGQNIYSPECAPDGFSLIDPDHITGMNINLLHNHWLQRQKKKLQPFVILNSGPLHRGLVGKSEKKREKKKSTTFQSLLTMGMAKILGQMGANQKMRTMAAHLLSLVLPVGSRAGWLLILLTMPQGLRSCGTQRN
jgi:hypothetical protein